MDSHGETIDGSAGSREGDSEETDRSVINRLYLNVIQLNGNYPPTIDITPEDYNAVLRWARSEEAKFWWVDEETGVPHLVSPGIYHDNKLASEGYANILIGNIPHVITS